MRGFEPVTPVELAEFPAHVADNTSKSIRLLRNRGQLERIALADGKPVLARLVIRAPEIDSDTYSQRDTSRQYLLVNTANDYGTFGGLTLNIKIDQDAAQVNKLIYTQK